MAENQLMFGLKRQYAKTLGMIAAGEDRGDDLAHLAAVIRIFKPNEDVSRILPIRPYTPDRRQWSRTALDILRKADRPLAARELARMVLDRVGAPCSYLVNVECSLHAVLGRLEGSGVIRAEGSPKRWRVE
jgi:hypothetical protein